MIFNERSKYAGTHALLSASSHHWINYDLDKMRRRFRSSKAASEGVAKHELARMLIQMKQRLPEDNTTMSLYVNDAIDLGMRTEQMVFYSENAYGTADAIRFDEMLLRLKIFDLKTGVLLTSVHQLEIYAALFCLEYGYKPFELDDIELRIYQNDEVLVYSGDPDAITRIMDKIVTFNAHIEEWKLEALP